MKTMVRGFDVNQLVEMAKKLPGEEKEDIRTFVSDKIRDSLKTKIKKFKRYSEKTQYNISDFVSGGFLMNDECDKLFDGLTMGMIVGNLEELLEKIEDCVTTQEEVNLLFQKYQKYCGEVSGNLTLTNGGSYGLRKNNFTALIERQAKLRYQKILHRIVKSIDRKAKRIEKKHEQYKLQEQGVKIKRPELREYDRIGYRRANKIMEKYPVWQLLAKASVSELKSVCNEWTRNFGNVAIQRIDDAKEKSKRTRVGGRLQQRLNERS